MVCPLGTGISGGLVQTFTDPSGASALGLGVQVCKARLLPTSCQLHLDCLWGGLYSNHHYLLHDYLFGDSWTNLCFESFVWYFAFW